ncbi:MAG: hypothetical protein CMI58_02770, partial [Parcubacteria group bacterium]|nr:hypothetical protein [Parcubacteria group bacterium]
MCLLGKIKPNDIQNELFVQMHEFQKADVKLETLDSHQHIHAIPLVFNSIINILIEKKINVRLL